MLDFFIEEKNERIIVLTYKSPYDKNKTLELIKLLFPHANVNTDIFDVTKIVTIIVPINIMFRELHLIIVGAILVLFGLYHNNF